MKKWTALLIALLLVTGFALSEQETDYRTLYEQAAQENERLRRENEQLSALLDAYADPSVIVAFSGGAVRFEEVYAAYEEVREFYVSMYEAFGLPYQETPEEAYEIQTQIALGLADEKLIDLYLAQNGIVLLDEEETAALNAQAQLEYEEIYDEVLTFYLQDGFDGEQADALTLQFLAENGYSLDQIVDATLQEARQAALEDLLCSEVEVSEEDLEKTYAECLETDRAYYSEYPEEYGFDALYSQTPICFVPEGYRRVRLVVIPFDEETMAAYDELYMMGETDSEEADRLFQKLRPEAQAVWERLVAGERFDEIRAEYPDTEAYMDELGRDEGFLISAESYIFEEEATDAIMALAAPGNVTAPLKCDWGYMIFEYVEDVESRELSYEEVRDSLYTHALDSKREAVYEEAFEAIRQAAHTVYFFERLN